MTKPRDDDTRPPRVELEPGTYSRIKGAVLERREQEAKYREYGKRNGKSSRSIAMTINRALYRPGSLKNPPDDRPPRVELEPGRFSGSRRQCSPGAKRRTRSARTASMDMSERAIATKISWELDRRNDDPPPPLPTRDGELVPNSELRRALIQVKTARQRSTGQKE